MTYAIRLHALNAGNVRTISATFEIYKELSQRSSLPSIHLLIDSWRARRHSIPSNLTAVFSFAWWLRNSAASYRILGLRTLESQGRKENSRGCLLLTATYLSEGRVRP
jgi:hypothetical protein